MILGSFEKLAFFPPLPLPASTLKKKSNAIVYHFVREGVARDKWRTAYVNTDENVADLLTKPLSGPKQAKFVWMIIQHVLPDREE